MTGETAAWILLLLATGVSLLSGSHMAAMSGPTRLSFLLDTGALICGLLVIVLIAPAVFG